MQLLEAVRERGNSGKKKKKFIKEVLADIGRFLDYKRKMIKFWIIEYHPLDILTSQYFGSLCLYLSTQDGEHRHQHQHKTHHPHHNILPPLIPLNSHNFSPLIFPLHLPHPILIDPDNLIIMFQPTLGHVFIQPVLKLMLGLGCVISIVLHINYNLDVKEKNFGVLCGWTTEAASVWETGVCLEAVFEDSEL